MSLPSGYKRLKYIQSNGTQYIDTGFHPNQDTRVFCDVVFVASSTAYWLFGARNGNQDSTFGFLTYDNKYRSDFNTSTDEYLTGVQSGRFTVDKDGNVTKINGETAKTATAGTFQCTHNLYLLANNNNGTVGGQCSATLYACQIYDNGTLIRDYIPCQTASGEVGLYDLVNSAFYGNAGTGTFTAGPVIAIAIDESEITKLEYIKSSGTQYADTGFQPNQDTTVEVTFETTQSNQCGVAATDQAWQSNAFGIWANCVAYGSQTDQTVVFYGIGKVTARLDRNKLYKNGDLIWTASAATFSCPSNLTLMALNRNGTIREKTAGNWYSSKIYDNGTIIRDYIAAKLSDGTVGLYDKLNGLLYINAGTGTFEAGPEVGVATPENFRLSSSTETTATLAWSAVDGATGYKLYRDGILIATLTDTSYTDTIQTFTSYIYTLTAYNGNGESDPASISVQIIIPPETPSNFRASSASMTAISLAWDAVTGADSYQLKRNGSVIYSGEGTSYTDSGLTADTAYTYTLSAVNTAGGSAETTMEVATTQLILVTDRTQADVASRNAKGTYNASDLNRVGAAMNYVADRLRAVGYDPHISPKTDWKDDDWVDPVAQAVYLGYLAELRKQFAMLESTPEVPPRILATAINSNDGLTYTWANDIEQILMDIDVLLTNIAAGWFYSGEIYSGEV